MDVRIATRHGLRNDLCLTISMSELQDIRLSMPGWKRLGQSYGLVRHPIPDVVEAKDLKPTATVDPVTGKAVARNEGIKRYKLSPEEHLPASIVLKEPDDEDDVVAGLDMVDADGYVTSRSCLIGNRNLGNNYGFVAWDKTKSPRCFHLLSEPILEKTYTCLVSPSSGSPTIEPVRFIADGEELLPVHADKDSKLPEDISWCTYGQQVLRSGKLVDIEDLLTQFYDIRHLFYFNLAIDKEQALLRELSSYYSDEDKLRNALLDIWHAGRPRSRYFYNAVGVGPDRLVVIQRHGTPEELGQWLLEAGATDGVLLDNGGSVYSWLWTAGVGHVDGRRRGGVVFSSPDWRPPTISCIALTLKGAVRHDEPPGSISFSC